MSPWHVVMSMFWAQRSLLVRYDSITIFSHDVPTLKPL